MKNMKNSILNLSILFLVPLILVFSEFFTFFFDVKLGLIFYVFFLFTLIISSSLLYEKGIKLRGISLRKGWKIQGLSNLLAALILLPLMRILIFIIPLAIFDKTLQLIFIGILLGVGIYFLLKYLHLKRNDVGLVLPQGKFQLIFQVIVALTGFSFGFFEYFILKPSSSIIVSFTLGNILISGLVLILITGFLEELMFRGIIQRNSELVFGKFPGLLFSTIIFTIMHISLESPSELIFAFFIGLFYGLIFQRTKNLLGISFSHGIGNFIVFIIGPLFIG
jgi:hypothetical protein